MDWMVYKLKVNLTEKVDKHTLNLTVSLEILAIKEKTLMDGWWDLMMHLYINNPNIYDESWRELLSNLFKYYMEF